MKTIKVATIVLDFDLYPRMNLDAKNVADLTEALSNGAELPPITIDKKSRRCVDGFHRVKAHLRLFGDDSEITAIEKSYQNDAAMFLDAIRMNAGHGAKLDSYDKTRCLLVAESLKIDSEDLSLALHMSVDKLASLRVSRTAKMGNLEVPIKRTISHMAGKRLNKRQQQANRRLSGMNQKFYVNQIMMLIESGLIDMDDGDLLERLSELQAAIGGLLAEVEAVA